MSQHINTLMFSNTGFGNFNELQNRPYDMQNMAH